MSRTFKTNIPIRFPIRGISLFANGPGVQYGGDISSGSTPVPPPPEFDPLTITSSNGSGAVLWLRADDVVLDGTKVARWNDKSGFGLHFTASTANQADYVATSSFASKSLVQFNRSYGYTSITNMNLTSTAKITIFTFVEAVIAKLTMTGGTIFDSTPSTAVPDNGFNIAVGNNTTGPANVGFVMTSQTAQTPPSEHATGSIASELPPTTAHSGVILIGIFDHNAAGGAKLQLTANYTPIPISYQGADGVGLGSYGNKVASLGRRFVSPTTGFSGSIMEVLVYNFALNTDQITLVTNYLSGRYY